MVDAIAREDADDAEKLLSSHSRRTRTALTAHPELLR